MNLLFCLALFQDISILESLPKEDECIENLIFAEARLQEAIIQTTQLHEEAKFAYDQARFALLARQDFVMPINNEENTIVGLRPNTLFERLYWVRKIHAKSSR